MKLLWTFCCLWALMLLSGCEPQPIPSYTPQITGSIVSREAIAESPLTNGSQALFNATGGTTISNQVFTLNNGVLQDEDGKEVSINPDSETTLTAIYPAYSGETLVIDNPYHDGTLQDVLIAQNAFSGTTDIQLKFHHLFSQLNVHVHSSIASSIEAVDLTAPKVTKIDPLNGTFTHEGTFTTQKTKDDSNVYSFIVPSIVDCPLTLTFIKDSEEEEVIYPLTHNFEAGHKYECHVNRPGIRNAKDLIAFAELINNPSYSGDRTLDEFRTINGTDTIYNLLADINLTTSQSKKLYPIGGYNNKRPFTQIFDGNGHTISGLVLKASSGYTGLFGKITSTAIVKNLTLTNCSSPTFTQSTQKGTGILVGLNEGTISNCHVNNSSITTENENSNDVGAIAGLNSNKIINSSVTGTKLTSEKSKLGAITGYLYGGEIINCYSYNNTTSGSSSYRGGISGYATDGTITNCYVYSNNKIEGQMTGEAKNTIINYSYYGQNSPPIIGEDNGNNTKSNNKRFDATFHTTSAPITHICDLLNQWIGEKEGYTHWKTDATLPAVFDK